jgi:hypothetical protein
VPDENSKLTPPSFEGRTPFEMAVEIVEYYKWWINWNNPVEVIQKPVLSALVFLLGFDLDRHIPEVLNYLQECTGEGDYVETYQRYSEVRARTMRDRTEFILAPLVEKEAVRQGQLRYYHSLYTLCLVDFLLTHRPCCRLVQTAWLIPAIAAGYPAIPMISYAAEQLADFINDPVEPFRLDCTPVGNSWLHRLGIYLLHQCRAQSIPPDPSLIRLMSLVSPPPSASVKSGKATRYSDYLADPEEPYYLHEAPPAQAIGMALALELLGEFDANRQGEHFRRIERAVGYYGHGQLNGLRPSVKAIQRASGLSWADAKMVVSRPFFNQLVFQYQCRYLAVEPCADCDALAHALDEEADASGESVRSSGSSW